MQMRLILDLLNNKYYGPYIKIMYIKLNKYIYTLHVTYKRQSDISGEKHGAWAIIQEIFNKC